MKAKQVTDLGLVLRLVDCHIDKCAAGKLLKSTG